MGKDRSNSLVLSSKKATCRFRGEQGREVEKLRNALEAERGKNRQAHRKFALELRRLKEVAERERQKVERDLTCRLEQQKALELLRLREALGREREEEVRRVQRQKSRELRAVGGSLAKERESAVKQALELRRQLAEELNGKSSSGQPAGKKAPGCLSNGLAYRRLEQLLLKLCRSADGEQATLARRLRQELDLEKSYFLRHLLEAHSMAGMERGPRRTMSCVHLPTGTAEALQGPSSCSRSFSRKSQSVSPVPRKSTRGEVWNLPDGTMLSRSSGSSSPLKESSLSCSDLTTESRCSHTWTAVGESVLQNSLIESALLEKSSMFESTNGTDYGYLVRQNSELLRALDDLEKTCATLREENGMLRQSSSPETEEKVKRLKRKNTELAVIAKRLEERARKLQEANLKVVNPPAPLKAGAVEQYKRAFARQRARDLAQHADTLLSKDKEIAALQREYRDLQARLGAGKGSPGSGAAAEVERLLRESQKEVLRLQRQLSVSSAKDPSAAVPGSPKDEARAQVPVPAVDDNPARPDKTHVEEEGQDEEQKSRLTPEPGPGLLYEGQPEGECLLFLESELGKKRKECESLEHEVRKRQKRCLDLENQLEDERIKNEQLEEEAGHLKQKVQLLHQVQVENEELREDLSELTAQRNSVLEENQRLRAKLENLEQVLKHMREIAERRQQLELEHEQALAILKFKQDEIKRLQRAQFFAKREHEGVVQLLEELIQLVLRRELAKVRELEEKCRSQSEQFGLLSHELERFRQQASRIDLSSSPVLSNPGLSHLTNGVGLSGERESGVYVMTHPLPADLAAAAPPPAGQARAERSPTVRHRELPTISAKSGSASSTPKSESRHLTPKSESLPQSPRKSSPTHEVDTASEVEELDIDVSPIPYPGRVTAKLQVFIARYSYNPYDGPNDNPEGELPLTAGEYIYVYGDMDDDGFYEGELMDGRRGLVPSNFVERVSDDDVMSFHPPEAGEVSHSSFPESSIHSSSERHLRVSINSSERTDPSAPAEPVTAPTPVVNGLDLDTEEAGLDAVPYPRKLTVIKQLAKSIIIGWDPPLVPAGWGNVWSYNVFVDQELRLRVPFGSQTKAVLERLDLGLKAYRVSVQSLTDKGNSDQLRCSLLVGRDVCVAPSQLRVERITATSAHLTWLPSNSNYVHIVSLNEEECELVKAGCCSLSLSNLKPNLRYRVKVEARPHRTPWELPQERRENSSAVTSFTTLMAGPPDAPLDVQLEMGPSPGILQISWLPVTIDAAGTSNAVRVTGYTIYADKNKVLEVSSPTAGSALLGPAQIHSLQVAHELTVRTTSAHGESADSTPIGVQARLAAIMAHQSAAGASGDLPLHASQMTLDNQAAKGTAPPHNPPMEAHSTVTTAEGAKPTYAEAWADPLAALALRAAPVEKEPPPLSDSRGNVTVNVTSSDQALDSDKGPDSQLVKRPAISISEFLEEAVSCPGPSTPAPAVIPSTPAPVVNPIPSQAPAKEAPEVDSLNPPDTHPLRPMNPSPLESEAEEESSAENARVVSIDEFLDRGCSPNQDDRYLGRCQDYGSGLMEPPRVHHLTEYQAESSRGSDLSDILEEEEEDLYSDPVGEERSRGYGAGAAGRPDMFEADSDEEVLKLPPQMYYNKQLFSIPEVTEEEDNSQELEDAELRNFSRLQRNPLAVRPGLHADHEGHLHSKHRGFQNVHSSPRSGHYIVTDRAAERSSEARDISQAGSRLQHRVHYSDTVDTISYPEGSLDLDSNAYLHSEGVRLQRPQCEREHRPHHLREGDRLRKEALLRSRLSSDLAAARRTKAPASAGVEIDIEYGTDNDDETLPYAPSEIVAQMSSEWWVEGGHSEMLDFSDGSSQFDALSSEGHRLKTLVGPYSRDKGPPEMGGMAFCRQDYPRSSLRRANPEHGPKGYSADNDYARETLDNGEQQLAEPGATWCAPNGAPKPVRMEARLPKESLEGMEPRREAGGGQVRIFVALFPYDPAVMSPNPDATEEELPFQEGQIIKVYGDKDADGFYRGESGGRLGFVPCNMVSEIQVEDEETRDQLLQQGFLSAETSLGKIGTRSRAQLPRRPVPPPKPRRSKKVESAGVWEDSVDSSRDPSQAASGPQCLVPRKMVAVFDYDPKESSPNADIEAELTFSAGDIIYVFGEMDDDGFFYGDLNGQKGLVPSNFLQAMPEEGDEAAGGGTAVPGIPESRRESQVSLDAYEEQPEPETPAAEGEQAPSPGLPPLAPADSPTQRDASPPGKKKRGFFSKGKKLFKKLGSSKKE